MNRSKKTTKKIQWNSMLIYAAIYTVALAARLLKMGLDPMLQRDSALYLILAEKWHETGNYCQAIETGTIVPPLPLFAIVKAMDLGLDSEIAGRSTALFLGAMIPVLGYIISYKIIHKTELSLICAILLILHPTLISYSIQPLRENFYLFFIGLSIIAVTNGIRTKRMEDWCTSGTLTAFAVFCRYEAAEFLIFFPVVTAYLFLKTNNRLSNSIRSMAIFYLSFILTSILLLSIVNFNVSFITKTTSYFK